jgi:hypothetical protein
MTKTLPEYKEKKMSFLTDHIRDTENPQTYWMHGKFAFINSAILIYAGLIGMIHAIFPWWFQFSTSTILIKSFKKLIDSRRHLKELNTIIPEGYLQKQHLE